jgi:hypothetical protein
LVGTYRTFGAEGPLYKITAKVGETKVRIVVVESGEELDYLIERALRDPEAG